MQADIFRKHRVIGSCFNPEEGKHGWCGTCDEGAPPNTPGFCGDGFHEVSGNESEATKVTANSTNWGFCDEHCSFKDSLKDVIQVMGHPFTTLTIKGKEGGRPNVDNTT